MAIEVEYFGLTGMIGGGYSNDILWLKHAPTTGPNGAYDIAVDPADGPAQRYSVDFGVTHSTISGATGGIATNLPNSDIKSVLNGPQYGMSGMTGILWLRAVYNY